MATSPVPWRACQETVADDAVHDAAYQVAEVDDSNGSPAARPPFQEPTPRRSPRLELLNTAVAACSLNNLIAMVDVEPQGESITKENASETENPPPNLKQFKKINSRGPMSLPAIWYKKVMATDWDGSGPAYVLAKKRWRGWVGANDRRTKQRRESRQQTNDANKYMLEQRRHVREQPRQTCTLSCAEELSNGPAALARSSRSVPCLPMRPHHSPSCLMSPAAPP